MKKMCMMLLAALASTGSLFAQIRIDGNSYDWTNDSLESLVIWSNYPLDKYKNIYKAEFFADQMYIYYRFEFAADSVNAFEIFLDFDGDNTNGYSGPWQQSGANYMLELVKDEEHDTFGASLCQWKEGGDPRSWSWEEAKDVELEASNKLIVFGPTGYVEGRFYYPAVCANPDSIRVGVMVSNDDWNVCGLLPQINSGDTVSRDPMPFVKVTEQENIWTTVDNMDYLVNIKTHMAALADMYPSLTSVALPPTISFKGEDYSAQIDVASFLRLTSVEFDEGWQEIGCANFSGSSDLESLIFPSTLQLIEDNCFAGCTWMHKMIVKAQTPPTIFANTFEGVRSATPVYVPDESIELYYRHMYWSRFSLRPMSSLYQGVHSTKMDTKATKRIVNGQLIIDRDGKTYNALGWH